MVRGLIYSLYFLFATLALPSSLTARQLCSVEIKKLHPLQYAVGKKEVQSKRREIKKLKKNESKRKKFLKKKIVPVILGPDRVLYILDHHHTVLALQKEGFDHVTIHQIADYSKLSLEAFYERVVDKHWVRLKDEKGREIAWQKLEAKKGLKDLPNDPYRSLAGMLRDAGGFEKTETPFYEFLWADFLRTRIPTPGKKISWKRALREALRLAKSPDAPLSH